MSDLISREATLKHLEKRRQDALMMDDLHSASIIMNGMLLGEEAVRNQPSAQPEKRTETHACDLISRQAAIATALEFFVEFLDGGFYENSQMALIARFQRLPSAQPEQKTGHWERHNTHYGGIIDPDWRCSECGGQANVNVGFMYDLTDFCPHCGADMKGEQDEGIEHI